MLRISFKTIIILIIFVFFGIMLHKQSKTNSQLNSRLDLQQRQLALITARLLAQEKQTNYTLYDFEQLADRLDSFCISKSPRPPMSLKGRR
jgi:sensor histidine kinase regulating citrate/malate metabolism